MASPDEIRKFLLQLINLALPRTASFPKENEFETFVGYWTAAFTTQPIEDLRKVWPKMRDTLKYFPTIAEVKELVGEKTALEKTHTQPFLVNHGTRQERTVNGRKLLVEPNNFGYTILEIDGTPVFPAICVMTNKIRVAKINENSRGAPMEKIDLNTLSYYDREGKIQGSFI